ncbi:MAG: DNA (cytosine-5-)-methyltransferase, partial [Chloroflexales bacterium]
MVTQICEATEIIPIDFSDVVKINSSSTSLIWKEKLARVHSGKTPRVLDLFSGCGGISLGFQRVDFEIVGAVEFDALAAQSHALNFHNNSSESMRRHGVSRDITKTEPEVLIQELQIKDKPELAIDVIIGGPPCQAFARVGRAKLREVAVHPEAFRIDPRGDLYLRYLHYVRILKPLVVLMENVPDVLNYGGHNIPQEMAEVLSDMGYVCKYTLLNSAYYGVPQMRERMFLIAYAETLHKEVHFP